MAQVLELILAANTAQGRSDLSDNAQRWRHRDRPRRSQGRAAEHHGRADAVGVHGVDRLGAAPAVSDRGCSARLVMRRKFPAQLAADGPLPRCRSFCSLRHGGAVGWGIDSISVNPSSLIRALKVVADAEHRPRRGGIEAASKAKRRRLSSAQPDFQAMRGAVVLEPDGGGSCDDRSAIELGGGDAVLHALWVLDHDFIP